jgi:hypothetical protein
MNVPKNKTRTKTDLIKRKRRHGVQYMRRSKVKEFFTTSNIHSICMLHVRSVWARFLYNLQWSLKSQDGNLMFKNVHWRNIKEKRKKISERSRGQREKKWRNCKMWSIPRMLQIEIIYFFHTHMAHIYLCIVYSSNLSK